MKDLLNLLKSQGQSEEFDSIRISLASPEDGAFLVLRRS